MWHLGCKSFFPRAANVGFFLCRKRRGETLKKVTKVIKGGTWMNFVSYHIGLSRRIEGHMKICRTNGFLKMRGWICSDLYLRM